VRPDPPSPRTHHATHPSRRHEATAWPTFRAPPCAIAPLVSAGSAEMENLPNDPSPERTTAMIWRDPRSPALPVVIERLHLTGQNCDGALVQQGPYRDTPTGPAAVSTPSATADRSEPRHQLSQLHCGSDRGPRTRPQRSQSRPHSCPYVCQAARGVPVGCGSGWLRWSNGVVDFSGDVKNRRTAFDDQSTPGHQAWPRGLATAASRIRGAPSTGNTFRMRSWRRGTADRGSSPRVCEAAAFCRRE
jgi:hypothetical protein